jgi:NDP-sugar pyrophosphorylase family protein
LAKILRVPTPQLPFRKLAGRIQPAEGLVRDDWTCHCNGGGWVQKSAFVANTAFVGPYAIVSGDARVLDSAQIIDEASITDTAMVAGNAIVGGKSRVGGHARIIGTACILGDAQIGGEFFMLDGELRDGVSSVFEHRLRRDAKKAVQLQLGV